MDKITLVAKDGAQVACLHEAAVKMSGMVESSLRESTESRLELPLIEGGVELQKIVDYMEHHYNNPAEKLQRPLKAELKTLICEWDKAFLYTDLVKNGDENQHELLIKVMLGANYMMIQDLRELCCQCCAQMIIGKNADQVRALFHLPDDFTDEERRQIALEKEWCEDP